MTGGNRQNILLFPISATIRSPLAESTELKSIDVLCGNIVNGHIRMIIVKIMNVWVIFMRY